MECVAFCEIFEKDMESNLRKMADMLYYRRYQPEQSMCFVIEDPKKREVFAAAFQDRIVHHLYYNYTHELFERGFIADSYSCIKKRGIHYGVRRLEQNIRQESLNYTERCYILKMDISGYFMHIDRKVLLDIVLRRLAKMRHHKISGAGAEKWEDVLDFDLINHLSEVIIMLNPTTNCIFRGKKSDWDALPHNRSLFHSPEGCGLPIGNLTSQLFSNIYLGELDEYMKRTLRVRRYGRYVDDFYAVSNDKDYLLSLVPKVKDFLRDRLKLEINDTKTSISDSNSGVGFLGMYLKPHRRYIVNHTLLRISRNLMRLPCGVQPSEAVLNSYLGLFSHCKGYNLSRKLFLVYQDEYGYFQRWMKKYVKLKAD